MIAVDTNLLVYAHREDSDFHSMAGKCLVDLATSGLKWAIPWPCLHEFLAISTHPRVYNPPTPVPIALKAVEVWIKSPNCEMIGEEAGYFSTLKPAVTHGKIQGPMIHDARIAAICLHHRIQELWTADRDFSRFPTLKTKNPLTG